MGLHGEGKESLKLERRTCDSPENDKRQRFMCGKVTTMSRTCWRACQPTHATKARLQGAYEQQERRDASRSRRWERRAHANTWQTDRNPSPCPPNSRVLIKSFFCTPPLCPVLGFRLAALTALLFPSSFPYPHQEGQPKFPATIFRLGCAQNRSQSSQVCSCSTGPEAVYGSFQVLRARGVEGRKVET